MALTDYTGGAAQAASNQVANIQGLISGQSSSLTSYLSNVTGLNFIFPKGGGPFSQPNNPKSLLSGFAFDYYGEEELDLDIEATDHWAEDNSSIQDHAAIRPIEATLRGFVGEFTVPNPNSGIGGALQQLASKIQTVQAYAGKYTPGAAQALAGKVTGAITTAQGYVNQVSQYAQQAQNFLSLFKASGASRQQTAFGTLLAAAQSRQTWTLVTPWMTIPSVMITNLTARQDDKTASKSELSISVKQIRTVPVASTSPQSVRANSQGRAGFQNQPPQIQGSAQGPSVPIASLTAKFAVPLF